MAKLRFSSTIEVKATPERAFDYCADHRHVAQVLDGVTRWHPLGAQTEGVGARYDVEMVTFGVPLRNVLRLNTWRRPEAIGWISESGLIKQEGGFRFARTDDGVRIELHIAYVPPASVLGDAVAHRFDGLVRARLQRAMRRIRDVLEA